MSGPKISLRDGVSEFVLRPFSPWMNDGVFVHSYNVGKPKVREISQEYVGQSGDNDQSYLHGSSQFQCDMKILDTPTLSRWEIYETLGYYLAPNKRPYLYIEREEWSESRRALCRPDDASCVVGRKTAVYIELSLQLKIPSGEFESTTEYEYELRPPSSGGGLVYPIHYPITYGSGSSESATEVPVKGNVPTPPIYLIYGGQVNPSVSDADTGQTLSFTANGGLTIPTGSYVEIDVSKGTALMNGSLTNSVYNYIDFGVSSWWSLREKQTNRLVALADSRDDSAVTLVRFRDRFIL